MGKKNKKNKKNKKTVKTIKSEIIRLHPKSGDIFILNLNTTDDKILFSDEITESINELSELLMDITDEKIPLLVFGKEMDLSLMSKSVMLDLLDEFDDDESDIVETDKLTDLFN